MTTGIFRSERTSFPILFVQNIFFADLPISNGFTFGGGQDGPGSSGSTQGRVDSGVKAGGPNGGTTNSSTAYQSVLQTFLVKLKKGNALSFLRQGAYSERKKTTHYTDYLKQQKNAAGLAKVYLSVDVNKHELIFNHDSFSVTKTEIKVIYQN
jgi:hypothetical protein